MRQIRRTMPTITAVPATRIAKESAGSRGSLLSFGGTGGVTVASGSGVAGGAGAAVGVDWDTVGAAVGAVVASGRGVVGSMGATVGVG